MVVSVPVSLGTTIHSYLCSGMLFSDAPPCHYQPLCMIVLELLLCPPGVSTSLAVPAADELCSLCLCHPLSRAFGAVFVQGYFRQEAAQDGNSAAPLQLLGGIGAVLSWA